MPRSDLDQRKDAGEDDRRYRAFLLWGMCHPTRRSHRSIALTMKLDEKSIRNWRTRFDWDGRLTDVEAPRHASDLYAERFHTKHGGRELRLLEGKLAVAYAPPPEEDKTPIAKANDLLEELNREEERAKYAKDLSERGRRLRTVSDGLLVTIGRKLASGELDVRPSDLGQVARTYQILDTMEQRRLAMLPDPNAAKAGDDRPRVAPTSQRVLLAQHYGGDVLDAMMEDAQELVLIVGTMREQARVRANPEPSGEVLPFDPDEAVG